MKTFGTESKDLERSDYHVGIDIENPHLTLTDSVKKELDSLHSLSAVCTIHKVPEGLRQLDEKAYTPRKVSVGPIHHGRPELKSMEECKRRYLQNFLQRNNNQVRLEDFIEVLKEKEKMVRNCYAETIELQSDDFVKMILMDAAFILEILLIFNLKPNKYDRIFCTPHSISDILEDLYMLENQIPFFILEDLFRRASISYGDESLSIREIVYDFTKHYWNYLGIEESFDERKYSRVKHLVDFLRDCIMPPKREEKGLQILTTPSITQLHQAGVKFKLGSSKNLFDISFRNGELEIPQITIRSSIKGLVKNLLALEKSQYSVHPINDYVIFMNYLINTPKDVDLLVQDKIIHNPVGDSEKVSTLFHSLVERPTFNPNYFYFSSLVEDLNEYCRRPWHKWKATLQQDYFTNPWTIISFIAAVVLLILTVVQTVCSVVQM